MFKKYFITGTDTGVGKTHISAILTFGLKATYWKPIQSGLATETDTQLVQRITNLPTQHFLPERFKLKLPRSPHEAANHEKIKIKPEDFNLPDVNNHLVVEGAGGLMVPITWDFQIIDLIKKLDIPVILVTRTHLGTLNHTQLSIEALKSRNIEIAGYIMTGDYDSENEKTLKKLLDVPFIGFVPFKEIWKPNDLEYAFNQQKLN